MAATVEVRLEFENETLNRTITVEGTLAMGYGIMQGLVSTWADVWSTTPPDRRPLRVRVTEDGTEQAIHVFDDAPAPVPSRAGRG